MADLVSGPAPVRRKLGEKMLMVGSGHLLRGEIECVLHQVDALIPQSLFKLLPSLDQAGFYKVLHRDLRVGEGLHTGLMRQFGLQRTAGDVEVEQDLDGEVAMLPVDVTARDPEHTSGIQGRAQTKAATHLIHGSFDSSSSLPSSLPRRFDLYGPLRQPNPFIKWVFRIAAQAVGKETAQELGGVEAEDLLDGGRCRGTGLASMVLRRGNGQRGCLSEYVIERQHESGCLGDDEGVDSSGRDGPEGVVVLSAPFRPPSAGPEWDHTGERARVGTADRVQGAAVPHGQHRIEPERHLLPDPVVGRHAGLAYGTQVPLVGFPRAGDGGAVELGHRGPVAALAGGGKVLDHALVKGEEGQEAGPEQLVVAVHDAE